MDDSVLTRLLAGERLFVPGGHNWGGIGPGDIGGWYARIKRRGKFLHSQTVPGGVELWADDDSSAARRRSNRYETAR